MLLSNPRQHRNGPLEDEIRWAPHWARKVAENRLRDARQQAQLRAQGWHVEVVWECEARDPRCLERLARRLLRRRSS
jgi:G:T-mismatch repair DNA endonuclease (very short patch repair protein)